MFATPISLPSVDNCIVAHELTFEVRGRDWISATVRVNGHVVKRAKHPHGPIKVKRLPDGRLEFAVTVRAHGGRAVTAHKTYNPCVKPPVTISPGDPPNTLTLTDLKLGTGEKASKGQVVKVHYVGVAWSDRQEFDASYDRGEPFEFALGAGQVIPGFDQGIDGMRVGGRRQIIIPPELAYGDSGASPAIDPNETLVFVVDLVRVRH